MTAREGTQPQHVALSPIADSEHPERGTLADLEVRMLAPRSVHAVPCLTVAFSPYRRRFSHSEIQACERLLHRITAGPVAAQLLGTATTMQGEDPRSTGPFVLEDDSETERVPDSADPSMD